MGTTNSKPTENTGEIINNVTIEDVVQVENERIIWLLIAILIILLANTMFKIYATHRRGLRKRYLNSPARVAVIDNSTV